MTPNRAYCSLPVCGLPLRGQILSLLVATSRGPNHQNPTCQPSPVSTHSLALRGRFACSLASSLSPRIPLDHSPSPLLPRSAYQLEEGLRRGQPHLVWMEVQFGLRDSRALRRQETQTLFTNPGPD